MALTSHAYGTWGAMVTSALGLGHHPALGDGGVDRACLVVDGGPKAHNARRGFVHVEAGRQFPHHTHLGAQPLSTGERLRAGDSMTSAAGDARSFAAIAAGPDARRERVHGWAITTSVFARRNAEARARPWLSGSRAPKLSSSITTSAFCKSARAR